MAEQASEERGLPCIVRHEDAGGQCWRPVVTVAHGLGVCEVHGPEARIGALIETSHEAEVFLERVPLSPTIRRELEDALGYARAKTRDAEDRYREALKTAYPSEAAPEAVREKVREWQLEEERGRVYDELLDVLNTLHTMMRVAHEDGRTWLTEMLEHERETHAAQAAVAASLEEPARRR